MNQEKILKKAEYYAHNYFNMHEINDYKSRKEGYLKGYEECTIAFLKWIKENTSLNINNKILNKIFADE